jgi:predicted  nucleic acid-binding Zn-ribbon protein
MSTYNKIRSSPEYVDAVRDFENRIRQKLSPIQVQLAEIREAVTAIDNRLKRLEERFPESEG